MPTPLPHVRALPLNLSVPGVGEVRATVTVLDHGRLRYHVKGTRLDGVFVLAPETVRGGPVLPTTVRVQFGDGVDLPIGWFPIAPEEPVVNGVTLAGFSSGLSPDTPTSRFDLYTYASARGRSGLEHRIPDRTAERTAALISALLRDWAQRPDRHTLVRAAAARRAEQYAESEENEARQLARELQELHDRRSALRRRINQLNGVIRRRPRVVAAADPAPVRLPFVDRYGTQLGVLTVRERTVDAIPGMPGSVVYQVEGGRVRGAFTVGPYPYRGGATPEGVEVTYGHARSRFGGADDEPTVNGVLLSHGWSHSTSGDITATYPPRLPASIRTGRSTSCPAPEATTRRASGVLRALAMHYLSRPDLPALQLIAAKDRAPERLREARRELAELRARVMKAQTRRRDHLTRREQYLALLTAPVPLSAEPGLVPVVDGGLEIPCSDVLLSVRPTTSSAPQPIRAGRSLAA